MASLISHCVIYIKRYQSLYLPIRECVGGSPSSSIGLLAVPNVPASFVWEVFRSRFPTRAFCLGLLSLIRLVSVLDILEGFFSASIWILIVTFSNLLLDISSTLTRLVFIISLFLSLWEGTSDCSWRLEELLSSIATIPLCDLHCWCNCWSWFSFMVFDILAELTLNELSFVFTKSSWSESPNGSLGAFCSCWSLLVKVFSWCVPDVVL